MENQQSGKGQGSSFEGATTNPLTPNDQNTGGSFKRPGTSPNSTGYSPPTGKTRIQTVYSDNGDATEPNVTDDIEVDVDGANNFLCILPSISGGFCRYYECV